MSPELLSLIGIAAANIGLICWLRSESRNDWLHMDAKMDSHKSETYALIAEIKNDMKDFHTRLATQDLEFKMRLAAIEEKRKCL